MSAGNPFSQIAPTDEGQNTAPVSDSGNPFSAIASTLQPSADTPIGNQPASVSGVLKTLEGNGGITAIGQGAFIDPVVGAVKGLGDTVHGVGELIRKVGNYGSRNSANPGEGDRLIPPVGQNALDTMSTDTPGTGQIAGKTAENIAEFVTGDEALKGLSLADRALKAANLADKYEKAGTFAKAAMEAVFNGGRQGTVTAAQTLAKTADPTTAAEAGATGAVVGTGLSLAGKGISAIRDIYKPLETAEAVQPVVQSAIKDVAGKVAEEAGVDGPSSLSIRDTVSDVADNIKAKSQPIFQKIDELSNGDFSDAQADAARYRGSIDKAGKDAYADALQKQSDIFDSVKGQLDDDALEKAKASWKQYNALADVSDAIQKSVSGTRPEVAAASNAAQPAETVNPKVLAGKLNALYNDGTLQTAFGKNAHTILDHVGAAQSKLVSIADNLTAQQAKKRVVKAVAIRTGTTAAGTAVGGSAVVKGLSHVLGSGKH